MRKHKWRVNLLSEFCSKFLGTNYDYGVHVKLRLRRYDRDSEFFPFDEILDTMLHELCHNAISYHNAAFYKLWDQLRKEYDEFINKGIISGSGEGFVLTGRPYTFPGGTGGGGGSREGFVLTWRPYTFPGGTGGGGGGSGEGFDLTGRRLGGFSQPAISSLRHTALNAAQERAGLGSLLPSGPKRLGGNSSLMTALSPVQAAAMAAERRLQDDLWCASGSCDIEYGETSKDLLQKLVDQGSGSSRNSNGSDVNKSDSISRKRSRKIRNNNNLLSRDISMKPDFVDFTSDSIVSGSVVHEDDKSQIISDLRRESSKSSHFKQKSNFIDLSSDSSTSAFTNYQDATNHAASSSTWECGVCTLANPPQAPVCEVCGTLKPRDGKEKYKFWSCKFCTLENSADLEKCMACNEWRYSHGVPKIGT